jgi:hypothetical protein
MSDERRMPDVTARVAFDGLYEGWWAEIRVNAPVGVFMDLMELAADPSQLGRVLELLADITAGSNFVDRRGEPIDLTAAAGWRKVGRDLIKLYIDKLPEALRRPFAQPTTSSSPTSSDSATPPTSSP